jgi:hypothetical protein
MKRNTTLLVVLGIVGAIVFIDPFGFFRKPAAFVVRPAVEAGAVSPLVSYAQSHFKKPGDYLVSAFASHDIVFIGELNKIAENPRLVASVIPSLYAAGIREIGIEFALAEDQTRIDALLSAPVYDENEARRITMDWIVMWGFQEYVDIYKAAWQFNRSLKKDAKPFRIVALNVRYLYEFLKTQNDVNDVEAIKKVTANGVTDAFMADVIRREFTEKKEKALVYCGMQHASTRFMDTQYAKNASDKKLADTRRTAEIVRERIGPRAFTVLLHGPWPDEKSVVGLSYPVAGAIDALIDALTLDKKTAGFDTVGTPFGALPVKSGWWAVNHPSLTLADICDGYIVMGPIIGYHAVTPISGFITDRDAEYAVKNFPAPKQPDLTAEKLNGFIAEDTAAFEKMLRSLK